MYCQCTWVIDPVCSVWTFVSLVLFPVSVVFSPVSSHYHYPVYLKTGRKNMWKKKKKKKYVDYVKKLEKK